MPRIRAVRLVALRHSADVSHNIRQALAGHDQRLRADSIELLLHGAPREIAATLSALLERGSGELRLLRAAGALHWHEPALGYEQRLSAMFADDSEAVRAIAAYHAAELGLDSPVSVIMPAPTASSSLLSREFAHACPRVAG